jgi:uncharacterized protein
MIARTDNTRRGDDMQEHPNTKLIGHAYKLFGTGDLDLLRVTFADDVVWHQPGRSSLAGDYKGPEEVLGFLGRLQDLSGGTFKAEIVAVLADGERAVVLQEETARRGGAELDTVAAVEFEIHYGKVTEVNVYHADMYQFDGFWS